MFMRNGVVTVLYILRNCTELYMNEVVKTSNDGVKIGQLKWIVGSQSSQVSQVVFKRLKMSL